jgi:putative ABC transport system permease protein
VIAEVGLAFAVVVAAAVLGRGVASLISISPGFDPHGVLTARLSLPPTAVSTDSMPGFYDEVLRRISAVPGVVSAALTDCAPLSGCSSATFPSYLDRAPSGQMPLVGTHWATPTYFQTLGVPLRRGRVFTPLDRAGMPRVIVVSESMASQLWPGEDPLGKRIRVGTSGFNDGAAVVGVVADIRFGGIDSTPRPDVYLPMAQAPISGIVLLVRSPLPASGLVQPVRTAMADLAPRLPLYDIRTIEDWIGRSVARPRFGADMLALFGAIALVLAGVGIYGLVAYIVAQRTREIGIRIALGAAPPAVIHMVVRRAMALCLTGIALGMAVSIGASRLVSSLAYAVVRVDMVSYVGAAIAFCVVTALACLVPARRAISVDPVIAFRAE